MKRTFTASITQEGDWFVAQCLEVDVASQGQTVSEALDNPRGALELHFTPPVATGQAGAGDAPGSKPGAD